MVVKNTLLESLILFTLVVFSMVWRLVTFPESIANYKPDLLLLALFFIMIHAPNKINIWFAWFIGLLADSLSGFVLGNEALQFAFMALIVKVFHRRIFLYPIIQQSLVIAGISIILSSFNALIYRIIFDIPNYYYFYNIIPNALVWPIFYFAINVLYKRSYLVK